MRHIPEEILFDSRLVERHIAQGLVTREEVNKRLEKLADSSDLGELIDMDKLAGPPPDDSAPKS